MSFVAEPPWRSPVQPQYEIIAIENQRQYSEAPYVPQQPLQALQDSTMPSTTTTTTTTTVTMPHSSTPLSAKTNMPSSALPSTSELSQEDDWTKVKDPKEKKRIQNRVAQRTYRHRMKARLGELQARLDSHEGRARSQSATSSSATPPNALGDLAGTPPPSMMSNCSVPPPHMHNPYMAMQHHTPGGTGAEESSSPMTTIPSSDGKPPGQLALPMVPNLYEQVVDDTDPAMFPQNGATARMMNSPPRSQASPQPNGLLSPPGRPSMDQPQKMEQDWMMDCLKYQTQLLSRLNHTDGDPNYPQQYIAGENGQAMLNAMSQSEQMGAMTAFAQAQAQATQEGIEYGYDGSCNVWKTESGQGPSPAETLNYGNMSTAPSSGHLGPTMMEPTPVSNPADQSPPRPGPLDHVFEGVMKHVEAAGFESFDDLVTAYYSDTFGDTSPLAEEQRLSRNRRLPKVVADVSKAADNWSTWERRGFHEEILKTAESMVISEGADNKNNIMAKIGPMIEAYDDPSQCNPDSINSIKRAVQNELPNSWALTMALASDNRTSWNRDRSNTALATILLLKFSGRMPNEQLLRLLGSCLA